MNMENEKFTITLRVAGDLFPLTVRRNEEELYRKAADMIDNKLNFFRERYGEGIADKQMKMVALNIAFNLIKKEHLQDTSPIFERLEDLDKEIQTLL